jgi:hypothetical protein
MYEAVLLNDSEAETIWIRFPGGDINVCFPSAVINL